MSVWNIGGTDDVAHKAQMDFVRRVKAQYPECFENSDVLEIGSLNVNGSFRELFVDCRYVGVDIVPGRDVDVVMLGHQYRSDSQFDVVCSGECFEHDEYWHHTIRNMYDLLKKRGLLFFTCATTGRKEHGTKRRSDAGRTYGENPDYYRNLTEGDFRSLWNIESMFSESEFSVESKHYDLYFVGIKR